MTNPRLCFHVFSITGQITASFQHLTAAIAYVIYADLAGRAAKVTFEDLELINLSHDIALRTTSDVTARRALIALANRRLEAAAAAAAAPEVPR